MRLVGRTAGRLGVIAAGVVAVAVAAGVASAHVTVNPREATVGGFTKLTFRVPNEKDSAATTKLEVVVPTDKPIAFVSVKPVPGWTVTTESTKLATPVQSDDGTVTDAVSKITWAADGPASAIKPGQFQEFDVSAGPLPDTDRPGAEGQDRRQVHGEDRPAAGGRHGADVQDAGHLHQR
jgi:uncharacterized protein YcnI